ncbi:MAG: WG repeat-containing protein [Muribaculum sp.]|nr:WG repeat-containing protein [Muribaculum sp.]
MVKPGNVEILPASYEYITPFTNGYALAGVKEGSQYLLQAIISETGDVSTLNEKLYLPSSNQYFSDGKLVVSNRSGKFGYINPSGQFIIKCQFDNALPFKEGWAPVKQGNYFKYINDTYDRNTSRSVMVVDFHYGEMTLASCFYNGRAAIAYNKDFALIGTNGQKVRKLNETEFKQTYKNNNAAPKGSDSFLTSKTYVEYSENGFYGLKQGEDIIVKAQFNAFPFQYSDGFIVAEKNNRQGLLSVIDGNYSFDIKSTAGSKSELEVDRKGNIEGVNLSVSTPSGQNSLKLLVDCGNGVMQDLTSQLSSNSSSVSVSFIPILSANAENCIINATLENDGILVAETSNNFSVSYPIKLRVSQPKAVSNKADENDNVTIYSNIYNDSNKAVTVKVTLAAKQSVSHSYTIEPHGSVRISLTEKITAAQNVNASVSLSTGERANSTIYLEPYF